MTDLELAFIGSGNAFAPGGLCWNGFVANGRVLFEAPPSALMALNKMEIDPNALDTVVISHHHGDHFLGLPFLFLHWKYRRRDRPVTIVGPPETRHAAEEIARIVYPGALEANYEVNWIELEQGDTTTVGKLNLEALEVEHDDRLERCLGFAVRLEGARFGYTGDSSLCDSVRDLARRSPVLVSECASYDEQIPVHMNLVHDIPLLRQEMAPDSHLILTHLEPRVEPKDIPNTRRAHDFTRYHFKT